MHKSLVLCVASLHSAQFSQSVTKIQPSQAAALISTYGLYYDDYNNFNKHDNYDYNHSVIFLGTDPDLRV